MTFECVTETDLVLIHSNKLNYSQLEDTHIARISHSGTHTPHTHAHSLFHQLFPGYFITSGCSLGQVVPLSPSSPPGCSRGRSSWFCS